jgi:hypothetical protein
VTAVLALLATAHADPPKALNVMYYGNSFLENSLPWFHPTLARSAGLELIVASSIGPGWPIRLHVDQMKRGRWFSRARLFEPECNAVLIHHFYAPHEWTAPYYWDGPGRVWCTPPRDYGDIAGAAHIISLHQMTHPDGRAFIYNSWPGIPDAREFKKRVKDELMKSAENSDEDRAETLKQIKERKLTFKELEPLLREFDYQKQWLMDYPEDGTLNERAAASHTRDYCAVLMEGLKKRFPKMWQEGRLALIPNGEVFFELDRKMRAGKMPGVPCVGYYSRDGGHVRAGLPRYTLAATCFAVMFQRHPKELDYAIYNDLENYRNENIRKLPGVVGSSYCHQPDLGTLLEITPERAKIVNDTVWEVVTKHPYTQVR